VNQLEEEAAALVGKEASLFVSSGTMGNLLGLMVNTNHGDEVILESEAHIYYYEVGGLSAVAGLMPRLVPGDKGVLVPDRVRSALRRPNIHYPRTKLLCIENTHNRAGGTITPPERMKELRKLCDENGLQIHLDGARIFNAAVAMDLPETAFTIYADTVMFCLSKGLGAPVGSMLTGSKSIIREARRIRKMLGGGMRHSGFLAAAGLVAIRTGIPGLKEDHRRVRKLALALQLIPGLTIDMERVQTNIVLVDFSPSNISAIEMRDKLIERGIRTSADSSSSIRIMLHKDIKEDDIQSVVEATSEILKQWKKQKG
jgi:threonine aldolase